MMAAVIFDHELRARVLAPPLPIAPSGEVPGQLYDQTTGAFLYDQVTGAPITA